MWNNLSFSGRAAMSPCGPPAPNTPYIYIYYIYIIISFHLTKNVIIGYDSDRPHHVSVFASEPAVTSPRKPLFSPVSPRFEKVCSLSVLIREDSRPLGAAPTPDTVEMVLDRYPLRRRVPCECGRRGVGEATLAPRLQRALLTKVPHAWAAARVSRNTVIPPARGAGRTLSAV
jgi:hypothetical protein